MSSKCSGLWRIMAFIEGEVFQGFQKGERLTLEGCKTTLESHAGRRLRRLPDGYVTKSDECMKGSAQSFG